jgi:creatinine amidohydrolase
MTKFFAFEELTWPEVAELPRDIPLVIPLGKGYSLDRLAACFAHPEQIGLLPGVPYGWRGSGLAVPEKVLQAFLLNLLDSLQEDGFTNVKCLTPQDLGIDLDGRKIALSHPTQHKPSQPIPAMEDNQKVVIVPIGHTEQHGLHLPLSTDTTIIGAIATGVTENLPLQACNLPVWPYGVSTHRQAFAGTLNAGGRAFEDFWVAVVDVLVARGFDRMYLISGHGGNCSFLQNVIKYAGERHRRIFCATAWLYLSDAEGSKVLYQHRQSPIGGMGHAGELETSLVLHLRQDLVHMDRVIDETNYIATPNYYMDWNEGGALIANPPWDDDTKTGAYGAGSLATPEKGKIWLEAAIQEKSAHVLEIHEQQKRREERRNSGYGLWGGQALQDSK